MQTTSSVFDDLARLMTGAMGIMQTTSSVFDDLARLMTGAMGMAQGAQLEARSFMRAHADRFVAEMDLISRDEFEVVKQQAADARAEADALKERVAALEVLLNDRA